jgi:hypothetical protein
MTTTAFAALMVIALAAETRTPPRPAVPSRVIDLVMVTAPKPPGSRVSISPPVASAGWPGP